MNDENDFSDPVDTLLQQAMATELERAVDAALIERISGRIHREQRLRSLLQLGVLGVVGLATLFASLQLMPALGALAERLATTAIPEWLSTSPSTVAALAAVVLFAPWLYVLVDDPL